ncbi:hypothetical protein HPB50_028392 [Hyalomma asiaticum]|nr:hypothetical protein HPB50_028392 [Hyalomma asiaticum]
MIFFVYVRYVFDKVKKVTTSNHVKGCRPKHSRDFKAGEVYSVYWEGDSRTAGSYYEAEILHMTEDPAAPEDNTVAEMALAEPQEQPPEQPRQDSRVLLPHAGSETVEEPLPSPPVCSIMGNGMTTVGARLLRTGRAPAHPTTALTGSDVTQAAWICPSFAGAEAYSR